MKHTLPALIEDLQAFEKKVADPNFLIDVMDTATDEQKTNLMLWVYEEYSNPILIPDAQGAAIWVDGYDRGIGFMAYEDIFVGLYDVPAMYPDEQEYRLEVAAKLEEIAAKIRGGISAELSPRGTGFEFLSATVEGIKNAKT